MRARLFALAVMMTIMLSTSAAEPQWLHPWQHELSAWLKSLSTDDLMTEVLPIDPEALKSVDDLFAASQGYGDMHVSMIAGIAAIPAEAFTWSGIWQAELPLEQAALKDAHHGLTSGQIVIPSQPNAANWVGWAYTNERSWNTYRGNAAMARRAAVISIVDLMMQAENHYHYHDPASSREGQRYGLHQGIMGFTLTFNALTLLQVQDILPEEARVAWRTGLKFMFGETVKRPPTGPANMRISLPVALFYAWLATEDPDYLTWYNDWEQKVVFGSTWDPAGIYLDGGAPDASYNGIALHRVAELYAINRSDRLRGLLKQAYSLRNHMSLPEPDGHSLAPSHFNDRCASSFPNDQYSGREVIFALDVPEALPALKKSWRMLPPEALIPRIVKASATPSKRTVLPHMWGKVRLHDWQAVLALPYAMYHQSIPDLREAMAQAPPLPAESEERYARSFNDHFFAVKRPGYAALFYAGPVSGSDAGRTNYRNMLSDRGGMFNGFAGGGLSAFWVQGAGSMLLGRMNQYENYERISVTLDWGTYAIPGWQDWMNNHVIGLTRDGKILTSARCSKPEGRLNDDGEGLTIRGTVPNQMKRQGVLFDGTLAFTRHYTFLDDRLTTRLDLMSDTTLELESLYETLPVRIAEDTTMLFADGDGRPLTPAAERVENVRTIQLRRGEHGVDITFPAPVSLALIGETTKSKQAGPAVHVRAVHVVLPSTLPEGKAVSLTYELKAL